MSDTATAEVEVSRAAAVPWTQSLVRALPVAPVWTALGIWAGIVGLCLAVFAVFGGLGSEGLRHPLFVQRTFPAAIVMGLIIAYAPAATAYSQRAALRLLRELRPVLRCSDAEFAELETRITAFDRRVLRAAGLAFVLAVVPFVSLDPTMEPIRAEVFRGGPLVVWIVGINVVFNWMMARLIFHELQVSWTFSRIAERYAEIDLLNSRPLLPFAHRGLQGALVWILFTSLMGLHYAVGSAAAIMAPAMVALLGVALTAFLLPVWGIHRRLAEAKRDELARLSEAIEPARAQLFQGRAAASGDSAARLTSLLLLKEHVEAAREWPFDVPTLARFALYLAIGLGSWLGGAVVERALDAILARS